MKLDLENEKISKLLWRYAIPSIIGGLVFMLYNVVDRIFISRGVGSLAMAPISSSLVSVTTISAGSSARKITSR